MPSRAAYDATRHVLKDLDRSQRGRHRRRFARNAVALAYTFALAACGASAPDSAANADNGNPDGQASAAGTVENQGSDNSTGIPVGAGVEPGVGMIEIGDVRHDLTVTRCYTMADSIAGDAVIVSEPDNVDVSFTFAAEDAYERDVSEGWTKLQAPSL